MTIRAIFAECSMSFWVNVASRLADESDWEPCYWVASSDMEGIIKDRFPKAVFHSNMDAIRGIATPECSDIAPHTLDQTFLQEMAVHESIVLRMMDRMDPGGAFSHKERLRLYYRLLRYWQGVLIRFQPDIVVFPTSPHVIYDYVLYALCQRASIKTVMFDQVAFGGLLMPLERFEGDSPAASLYMRLLADYDARHVELSPDAEAYLSKVRGDYAEAIPFYFKEKQERLRRRNPLYDLKRKILAVSRFGSYMRYGLRAISRPYSYIASPSPPNYLKQKGRKIEDSYMTGFEYRRYKTHANSTKQRLRSYYRSLAQDIRMDVPYVYAALHYQPERTTSPNGGVFADQQLMIEMLSDSLPDGWLLYVKEHPSQFSPMLHGERATSFDFYDDVDALSNVRFVSLECPSFDLIDNARAVATVAGTASWEAALRGKPSLIFGHPWYRGCEGVFYAPDKDSCADALAAIEAGHEVDMQLVRLFLYALEQVCFKGYVQPSYARRSSISEDENVKALARSLSIVAASDYSRRKGDRGRITQLTSIVK